MQKLGTGVLVLLGAVLVVLAFRTLDRVQRLGEKVDALETRVKAPPARLSPAPAPEAVAPPSTTPPAAPSAEEPPAAAVEPAREATTFILGGGNARSSGRSTPLTVGQIDVELTPEQKRALEGVLEARRREQLQIDGDAAYRHLELERRYDVQIRSWLNPEQQRRFDANRPAPRRDGPLAGQAEDYVRRDPAPYDLEVEWRGTWWPARTKDVRGEMTLIHYVGHGDEWHEWVGPERVRPRR